MVGTFTFNSNSLYNENIEEELIMNTITISEKDFYENLKPALNSIMIEPSNETVSQILNFSKSI